MHEFGHGNLDMGRAKIADGDKLEEEKEMRFMRGSVA